jgi:hypothetical protein
MPSGDVSGEIWWIWWSGRRLDRVRCGRVGARRAIGCVDGDVQDGARARRLPVGGLWGQCWVTYIEHYFL